MEESVHSCLALGVGTQEGEQGEITMINKLDMIIFLRLAPDSMQVSTSELINNDYHPLVVDCFTISTPGDCALSRLPRGEAWKIISLACVPPVILLLAGLGGNTPLGPRPLFR